MDKIHNHIDTLITKPASQSLSLTRRFLIMLGIVSIISCIMGLWLLGLLGNSVRAGYPWIMMEPLIAAKQVIPLLISATTIPLLLMLIRPEAKLAGRVVPVLISIVIMPIMMLAFLLPLSANSVLQIISSTSVQQCLVTIPIIASPILCAQLVILRNGAITKPVMTGWLAGLAAGGIATAIYALVCTEDNPGFYGLWYSLNILFVGFVGALLGRYSLRW